MKMPAVGVLRLVAIEFRRSVGLLVFPVLMFVGWWLSGDVMYGDVYVWIDTSAGVRYTALFLGPLVGGVSAWMAGRNRRRGMMEMLSTTSHPSVSRDLVVWAGTALWGVLAYLLLAVILGVMTWWNATWGVPLPGYLLVGLLAVVANSAIGYAVGYWLTSRFVAPLVAVGLFFLQLAPEWTVDRGPRLDLLSPAPNSLIYRDAFQPIPQVAAQQSLWFLGLAGAALAVVALRASRANLLSWVAFGGSLTVVIAGFSASVGAADQRALDLGPGKTMPFEYVCRDGRTEVCVHPAYERLLPETAETVNEVAEPLAGIPGTPTRAVQIGDLAPYGATTRDTLAFSTSSIRDNPSVPLLEDEIARGLVQDQAALEIDAEIVEATERDLERCGDVEYEGILDPDLDEPILDPAYEAQEVVKSWLLKRTGNYDPGFAFYQCSDAEDLADRFANLEPAQRRAWLEENFEDLRAGKLTLKDLP